MTLFRLFNAFPRTFSAIKTNTRMTSNSQRIFKRIKLQVFSFPTKLRCSMIQRGKKIKFNPWEMNLELWCTTMTSNVIQTTLLELYLRRNIKPSLKWRKILFPRRLNPTVCCLKVALNVETLRRPRGLQTPTMNSGIVSKYRAEPFQ